MIKVNGAGGASSTSGARRTARAGGEFRIGDSPKASGAGAPSALAPAETLSALIALQSGAGRGSGRAKSLASARRSLELLDRLRMSLLEGTASTEDLEALESAALAGAPADLADSALSSVCAEIGLRARVELAKRGR